MKKRLRFQLLSILTVLAVTGTATAKRPEIGWNSGQLTLWNGTLLNGTLSYNWSAELVMFRQPDGCVRTFSAGQVCRFGWFDRNSNRQRYFLSLARQTTTGNRPIQSFFEVYMEGPLAVVRRLKRQRGLSKRLFGHPIHYTDKPMLAQEPDYFDYFAYDDGQFLALDRFYVDIYRPRLAAYDRELQRYVRDHNINDRTLFGRLILIDRYNILLQQETETASARHNSPRPD